MKVIIFGGTGSIGRALVKVLQQENFEVVVVTRNAEKAVDIFGDGPGVIQWDPAKNQEVFGEVFTGQYAIINLAGENVGSKLWTKKQKSKILNSRITITSRLSEIVNRAEVKPTVFIQASATGYYGNSPELEFDESSLKGAGFLSDVCEQWEDALKLDDNAIRTVFLRTGLVLDTNDGLVQKMKISFKFFAGGHFGNGKQWMSWIHIWDEVRAILFLLKHEQTQGIFNLTAPKPERMRKFCNIFGAIQFRLSWLHIPTFLVNMLPGGMGEEILLSSQKVKPVKLQAAGFEFKFKKLEDALRDLLREKENG